LNLDDARNSLKNLLSPVLQKYGVQNADFITTPFDANGQGMDAVIDRVKISINKDQITNNTIIEIKDSTTNETIATGKISNGKANPSHRYFAYIKDDYGSPEYGPIMVDVVEGDNGQISATMTAIEGDTIVTSIKEHGEQKM
jgi:hypothetical protein